uniref:Uncharacterized protein n=1 Tax=Corethron hystrix TaxID=216773 RepID=A0A7S1FYC4_9STRA|mmetsp:Transcript_38038/g.88493  ORF Transcript_38038/g.88493 Transcript_38038/m.88493 type:complete len:111 (+) Transcript_38038:100-432(+)
MLSNIRSEDEDLDIVIFTESDAIDLNGSGSNDLATQDYEVREEVTQPSRTSPRSNIATAFQKMSANVSESAAKAKDFIKEKAYRVSLFSAISTYFLFGAFTKTPLHHLAN